LPRPAPQVSPNVSVTTFLPNPRGIAILAHPYAPLGGTSSDPVLALARSVFLSSGFIVLTFDFRGAGRSGGTTSWTADAEVQDFVSMVGFGIGYLKWLKASMAGFGGAENQGYVPGEGRQYPGGICGGYGLTSMHPFEIVLGGYSYGSLVVQKLPLPKELLYRFLTHAIIAGSPEALLDEQAQLLADEYIQCSSEKLQPQQPVETPSVPSVGFSYLLISPLLWPLSAALTLQMRPFDPDKARGSHKTRAIFGGQDGFTSAQKLEKWARRCGSKEYSRSFTYQLVEEAGHFWREPGVAGELQEAIRTWLRPPP